MRLPEIALSGLPAWAKKHKVDLNRIVVQSIPGKGFGLVAEEALPSKNLFNSKALLKVPKELVLSANSLKEHARLDKHFKELLNIAGGVVGVCPDNDPKLADPLKSLRRDTILFLLIHMTLNSPDCSSEIGLPNAWTEYIRVLPASVPVPTTWTDEQQLLLKGTSLETALAAKLSQLAKEFRNFKEVTGKVQWCQRLWWDSRALIIDDWILLDAWYRSRVLQLPHSGESMVPCVDMVNHSCYPKMYYEEKKNGDATILLQQDSNVEVGEELCITYGSEKSAAEMLFSYGFVDEEIESNSMVLEIQPPPDDPLGRAKVLTFKGRPTVKLISDPDSFQWISRFLFFLCLNEEDGLNFKVSQGTDDSKGKLQVFWQDKDVTETTDQFQDYIKEHTIHDIFVLRAVSMLEDRIREQREELLGSDGVVAAMEPTSPGWDKDVWRAATKLRLRETAILEEALDILSVQRNELTNSPTVISYLSLVDDFNQLDVAKNGSDGGDTDTTERKSRKHE